jgi:hypothetical protein
MQKTQSMQKTADTAEAAKIYQEIEYAAQLHASQDESLETENDTQFAIVEVCDALLKVKQGSNTLQNEPRSFRHLVQQLQSLPLDTRHEWAQEYGDHDT